ncbi:MAG: hypothetical protein ACFBSD_16650 [Paracoccaceae bacterium]
MSDEMAQPPAAEPPAPAPVSRPTTATGAPTAYHPNNASFPTLTVTAIVGVFVLLFLLSTIINDAGTLDRSARGTMQPELFSVILPQDPGQVNYPSANRTVEDLYIPDRMREAAGMAPAGSEAEGAASSEG